ncbi:thermonuclease family protein [Desulforhabdus sp. TSK]|uniref:thermonuclease family protein n=1 Tax=Desulforhabdus sp. TSK TaxID=2925014 RepID=UPI001FC8AA54|nr:thermonuclease family protein [Desulforhabdus sp. TSK]GKT10514.1 hypothetical protein DSTSK_38190 [Desulforhabdus sp. TSK]
MTWLSHGICGVALALGSDYPLPACVAGSLAPDLVERVSKRVIPHRTISHSLILWLLGMMTAWWTPLFPFFLSALVAHLGLDAFNPMGVPLWDGTTGKRLTLFYGRLRNGTTGEWVLAFSVAFLLYAVIPAFQARHAQSMARSELMSPYEMQQIRKKLTPFLQFFQKEPPPQPLPAPAISLDGWDVGTRLRDRAASQDVPDKKNSVRKDPNASLSATVLSAYDGDTLTVRMGARVEKVRLIGIDCPEKEQAPWGIRARDFVRSRVLRKRVAIEMDLVPRDRYGRLLGYVWVNDRLLNEELVEQGLAMQYSLPPNVKYAARFSKAVRKARENKAGFWREGGLEMSPSEWRRSKR